GTDAATCAVSTATDSTRRRAGGQRDMTIDGKARTWVQRIAVGFLCVTATVAFAVASGRSAPQPQATQASSSSGYVPPGMHEARPGLNVGPGCNEAEVWSLSWAEWGGGGAGGGYRGPPPARAGGRGTAPPRPRGRACGDPRQRARLEPVPPVRVKLIPSRGSGVALGAWWAAQGSPRRD